MSNREFENHDWWTTQEVANYLRLGLSTMHRYCAARVIDPRCGLKMGGKWRFKRSVIENEGLILKDQN